MEVHVVVEKLVAKVAVAAVKAVATTAAVKAKGVAGSMSPWISIPG